MNAIITPFCIYGLTCQLEVGCEQMDFCVSMMQTLKVSQTYSGLYGNKMIKEMQWQLCNDSGLKCGSAGLCLPGM